MYFNTRIMFCFDLDLHLTCFCFVHVHQHVQLRIVGADIPVTTGACMNDDIVLTLFILKII